MYHFNESPGAEHVGKVTWGPCQTIHLIAAALLFIPVSYLIHEKRKIKKGDVINVSPKTRRTILVVPQILAAILTIAGAATPQAWNHKPTYDTAMRYDIMSFDYNMSEMKDTIVCAPFFNRLVAGATCTVLGCLSAFVAFVACVFAARRPLVGFVATLSAFCFGMCSVALVGNLIVPINCDDAGRNQGALSFGKGSICLFFALGLSFITTFIAGLSIKLEVHEKDLDVYEGERALLSTEVNNYGA